VGLTHLTEVWVDEKPTKIVEMAVAVPPRGSIRVVVDGTMVSIRVVSWPLARVEVSVGWMKPVWYVGLPSGPIWKERRVSWLAQAPGEERKGRIHTAQHTLARELLLFIRRIENGNKRRE